MVNWRKKLRDFLLTQFNNVYATDSLPKDYKPTDGVAITFETRGGKQNDSSTTLTVKCQFKIYGASLSDIIDADILLADILNNEDKAFLSARLEQPSIQRTETNNNLLWHYALAYYTIIFENNE